MGDMKEIREAALAYYRNFSVEQKLVVYGIFQKWDTDGDGGITIKEFEQLFVCSGDQIKRIFQDLDKNGDGRLDFDESITLVYCLVNLRVISCDGCKAPFLKGLYFTCVDCFDHNETVTFDLCTSCYGSCNYVHHHSNFLDNYALLRARAAYNNPGSTNQLVSRSRSKRNEVLRAVNTSIKVANTVGNIASVVSSCSIM